MKIKNLTEGLDSQQRSVPELPAMFRPKKISVLNNPTDPRHPMTGYAVGANESIRSKDPYDQGWRTGHRSGQDETACPYKPGTAEHAQWMAGYEEARAGRAQPRHYDEGRAGVDDTDTVGFSVNTEAAYTAVMKRFGDVIDHDETSGIMYAPAGVWPRIEMTAFDADGEGATRVEDDMMEAERNEMDTAAVQAALAKMAERHKGEKWTKEQLAALGKRIAARGQKPVKEDDVEDFLARGGKITQVKPNRGPRYPGTSLGSKHIGTLRGGRASSISGKSANTRPTVKPVVAVESITKEDIITKLKARLGDYLSDISKEIKKDPDLVDKLSAKAPGDQMGPPVKTVTTDDGKEIQIHGNEDDGFRISIKNRPANTKFKNLDEAVMACEMYCARRRAQTESVDYIDEAGKDACYNKVKSRYKIWPSAYASGALVKCRKVGAANWGNKSKK
jgi:ribosome modulation factor